MVRLIGIVSLPPASHHDLRVRFFIDHNFSLQSNTAYFDTLYDFFRNFPLRYQFLQNNCLKSKIVPIELDAWLIKAAAAAVALIVISNGMCFVLVLLFSTEIEIEL